tara:strand:- start:3059 stop:3826 length:768 start_codon:yes stop_codon:yes gene_type:complete
MKRFNSKNDLKNFLDDMYIKYNKKLFIEKDPIQIPHKFSLKEDIEISAFLTSIISWGNRKMIINNANKMMTIMGNSPYDFIINANGKQIERISFVHRTFNSYDLRFFIYSLKNIYLNHGGLERVFLLEENEDKMFESISRFRNIFFSIEFPKRTLKHISNPLKKSSCKRINMFLRWMVRDCNVDLGLWKNIPTSKLSCPLDTHSLRMSQKLRLVKRKTNDLLTLNELDKSLRSFDPEDPVKYDFSLFGLGVEKDF